jgi:hypothetical protein
VGVVKPGVQVTVHPERGVEMALEERQRRDDAIEVLRKIADGELPYDFDALGEILAERERSPFKYDS